jgi:imidazolonepropionase-like amidohydrolase
MTAQPFSTSVLALVLLRLPVAALTALTCLAVSGTEAARAQGVDPVGHAGTPPVREYRNGRWFDGETFVEKTMYTQYGVFVDSAAAPVDSVVDLEGRWVVPPYGEAHNHNVEASQNFGELVRRYLTAGVFYVKNPNVLPSGVVPIRDQVNRSTSVDATFAYGGITGPGGHPIGVVRRNVRRGVWEEEQGEGAFYYAVADTLDLRTKWPALLAHRPDFVKVYLLYSEEHDQRSADSSFVGQRGLDPDLLPAVVQRAHHAGLRVTAHVETAADFRNALDAGVDEIAHLPGFRGNEENRFPDPGRFLLEPADARRAARQGVVVVTTLGDFEGAAPDSVAEAASRVFRHNLGLLHDHGVRLAVGSDGYESVGVSEALQLHDLGIFTNRELLKMWVETTPRTIFPSRKLGRLEPGYEASFLVLGNDPLREFSAVRNIEMHVKRGTILDLR